MAIKPIDLPSAAGLNRGEGDVRHFSEGDSFSVPGLSGPTRELAERDNLLALKLNETIGQVNNKEQFVPIPVLTTTLPPNDSIVVTNFRIPAGFEARVLNASIASSPLSSDIELNIYYATGFGNTTGDVLVTTSDETSSGTSFKQGGEFVISIRNKGGVTLDVVASVLLTMRPIGEEGTLLVGSVIRGEQGPPGQTGPRGLQGPPGTGGAGSPGMVWTGEWVSGRAYNNKDVVSFPLYGTLISSYFCTVSHTADSTNEPPNEDYWDAVAVGSSGTAVGEQGPAGPAGSGTDFTFAVVNGTLTTGADWVGDSIPGYDGSGAAPSTVYPNQSLTEFVAESGTQGMAWLQGSFRVAFKGHGTFTLPSTAWGASCDYVSAQVNVMAAVNGTQDLVIDSFGTYVNGVTCVPSSDSPFNSYVLHVRGDDPLPVVVGVFGAQLLP